MKTPGLFALFLVLPMFLPGPAEPGLPDLPHPDIDSRTQDVTVQDLADPDPYPPAFQISQLTFVGLGVGFDLDWGEPCGDPWVDNRVGTRPILALMLNLFLEASGPLALFELYGLNDVSETTPLETHVFPWMQFYCSSGQCEVWDFSDGQADYTFYTSSYEPGRFSWGPEDFPFYLRLLDSRLDATVSPDMTEMTGVLGGRFPASDLALVANPFPPYTGTLLDVVVNDFALWPDMDLNGDCILDLENDGYSAGATFTAERVVIVDYDDDQVQNDGDGNGTPGDHPCRGYRQGCDDNCPRMWNRYQEDADMDGIGDVCDEEPTLPMVSLLEGLDKPVDMAYSSGGEFGQSVYVSEEGSGQVSRLSSDGRVSVFAQGMKRPLGLAFGEGGAFGNDLYVADYDDRRIKRIDPAGGVQTYSSFSSYYGEKPVEILFDTDEQGNPRMLATVQATTTDSRIKIFRSDGGSDSVSLGHRLPMDIVKGPGGDWPPGFYVSALSESGQDWEILRVFEQDGIWNVTEFLFGLDGLRSIEFIQGDDGNTDLFIAEISGRRVVKADPAGSLQLVAEGVSEPLSFLQVHDAAGYPPGVLVAAQKPSTVFLLNGQDDPQRFAPPLVSPRDVLYVTAPFQEGLYVAEEYEGRIAFVDPQGNVTPFLSGLSGPVCMARGPGTEFGDFLYITESAEGRIVRVDPQGGTEVFADGLRRPVAMAFSPGGEYGSFLYVTEQSEEKIGRVLRIDSQGSVETFAQWENSWPVDIDFLSWGGSGPDLFLTRTRMAGTSIYRELVSLDPAGTLKPGPQTFSRIAMGFEMPDSGNLASMFIVAESDGRQLGLLQAPPQGLPVHSILAANLPGEPMEVAQVPEGAYPEGLYVTLESGDLVRVETD